MRILPLLLVPFFLLAACSTDPVRRSHRTTAGTEAWEASDAGYVDAANFTYLAPSVSGGAQPEMETVRKLPERGYTTLGALRTREEFDLDAEAMAARDAGLHFVWIPVNGSNFGLSEAARLRDELAAAPSGGVFIHCASGNRVGAVWGLYRALTEGLGVDQAVAAARMAGMRSDRLEDQMRSELQAVSVPLE